MGGRLGSTSKFYNYQNNSFKRKAICNVGSKYGYLSQISGVCSLDNVLQQYDAPDPVYHGGTNFGTSGGPFITTSYDYDAPIDEYGMHLIIRCPAWSVSILPDCNNVAFNTAKVGFQTSVVEMVPEDLRSSSHIGLKGLQWDMFVEKAGIWGTADFSANGLVDHINSTRDTTDYLWYTTRLVSLHISSSGSGNSSKPTFDFKCPIALKAGRNEISLLSMTVGLQIGLEGEHLKIYQANGLNNVKWQSTADPPKNQPLTWYKAIVDPPTGDEPVGLDMADMGKGLAWLNGEAIGRYWPRKSSTDDECAQPCNYRGKLSISFINFMPNKCMTGCGEPTQRWYG
ncbi:hypothetical protein Scep_002665 [Stephania cephalantha]|uniref:beta-galactosidase n=1 Tax=Stephania cephalantha TaxID=152367 RepID=A0AAP0LEE2_9MAGN